jgi:gluconolactonase
LLTSLAVLACGSSSGDAGTGTGDIDLQKNPIQGIAPATVLIETGQYTDGPVWIASESVLLYTVPLNEGEIPGLYRVKPDGAAMKVRPGDMKAGTLPIGNAITPKGELLTLEAKRVTRGGQAPGSDAVPIAQGFPGAGGVTPFDTLNDGVVHANGTAFVTDPGYFADPPPLANRLYRIGADGAVTVADTFSDVPRPNGVALSPDQKTLYVGFERPVAGTKPYIERYNVNPDATLAEHAKFVDLDMDSSPDGVEVDKAGNVYVATKNGVEVFRRDGKKIGTVKVPEQPTGLAFGGPDLKTLYVTTQGTRIWKLTVNVPGINQ